MSTLPCKTNTTANINAIPTFGNVQHLNKILYTWLKNCLCITVNLHQFNFLYKSVVWSFCHCAYEIQLLQSHIIQQHFGMCSLIGSTSTSTPLRMFSLTAQYFSSCFKTPCTRTRGELANPFFWNMATKYLCVLTDPLYLHFHWQ